MKGKSSENWSLFRLSDRKQFDRVDLSTIDFFYRALPEALFADWLMWRDGFSGWRPFSELPLILKHLKKEDEAVLPPPVPEAILKFAEELTGSGVHELRAPSAEAETKFEKTEASIQKSDPKLDRERLADAPLNENSRSSVSVRALQAVATSSLKLSGTPNVMAGGAASLGKHRPKQEVSQAGHTKFSANVLTMPDEATLSLMLESEAATEDRNNVRYQKKFKIRIFTPKGIVAMTTIDCSISGFKLKDPLPEGLPRFFHVEIDLGPDGKIPLICSEVREKDGRPATRVRIQVNDYLQTVRSALMRAS